MQPGQIIEGRFRIDERADEGGMGTVFRGTDLHSRQAVAVKVLGLTGDSETERFHREAEFLKELSHPAIVRYIGSGAIPAGERYLVMEWVQGETLGQRLTQAGLNIHEALAVGQRIAEGLAAMHARGVIHRDLKPKNLILVDGDPEKIKIIDFGIARHAQDVTSLTKTGVMVGTMGYMSPEQARGTRVIDAKADLFGLGCVLYECLTGRAPFSGPDPISVRTKILLMEQAPVSVLNPVASQALSTYVGRLLAKEPALRPPSADAVARELGALRRSEQVGERHPRNKRRPDVTETRLIDTPGVSKQGPAALVCMVLVGTEDEELPTNEMVELRTDRRQKIQAVMPEDARLEVFEDGWAVLTLTTDTDRTDLGVRAAKFALRLRGLFPSAPMAIAAQINPADPVDAVIDRGAETAVRESLESIFADASKHPGQGAIRLDPSMVDLLPDTFEVVRTPSGAFLVRESGAPI